MSDWQVGDLAVCVKRGTWKADDYGNSRTGGPQKNGVYRVTLIEGPYLGFAEWDEGLWEASAFRKIRRDEHEDCEPEFVTLLNRIKRKVAA